MELRKCECGGDAEAAVIEFDDSELWCVGCKLLCGNVSAYHDSESQAIQAWNEGKVE